MTSVAAKARRRDYNRVYRKKFHAERPCYHAWLGIKVRCGLVRGANANVRRNYLPKKLEMEPAWRISYAAFEHWCLAHGWRKGLWVVRLDTDRGFTADNCLVCARSVQVARRDASLAVRRSYGLGTFTGMRGRRHSAETKALLSERQREARRRRREGAA